MCSIWSRRRSMLGQADRSRSRTDYRKSTKGNIAIVRKRNSFSCTYLRLVNGSSRSRMRCKQLRCSHSCRNLDPLFRSRSRSIRRPIPMGRMSIRAVGRHIRRGSTLGRAGRSRNRICCRRTNRHCMSRFLRCKRFCCRFLCWSGTSRILWLCNCCWYIPIRRKLGQGFRSRNRRRRRCIRMPRRSSRLGPSCMNLC